MKPEKMNPEVKALWLEALRNNKYQQGKLLLRPTRDTYCCLGVLCDLATSYSDGVKVSWGDSEEHQGQCMYYNGTWEDDEQLTEDSELPWPVKRWAGLNSENPKVEVPDPFWVKQPDEDPPMKLVTLAELNDEWNYSFEQIANLIEVQL